MTWAKQIEKAYNGKHGCKLGQTKWMQTWAWGGKTTTWRYSIDELTGKDFVSGDVVILRNEQKEKMKKR